jgi:predicted N-acetyltransferase YhbS
MDPRIELLRAIAPDRVPQLLELYASSAWWAVHRTRSDVEAMLAASDAVVGLTDDHADRLVAFARLISDWTYLAVVLDVIVDVTYQHRGIGRRLMDEVLAVPGIRSVESIELVCQPELVDFYARWGFTSKVGRSLLMRRTRESAPFEQIG